MKKLLITLLLAIAFIGCTKEDEPNICEECSTTYSNAVFCGDIIQLGQNIDGYDCEFDYLILEKGASTYLVCLDEFKSGLYAVGAYHCVY